MQSFVLKTAGCIALAAGSALAQSTLEAPLRERLFNVSEKHNGHNKKSEPEASRGHAHRRQKTHRRLQKSDKGGKTNFPLKL